jgi:hypothetical protein
MDSLNKMLKLRWRKYVSLLFEPLTSQSLARQLKHVWGSQIKQSLRVKSSALFSQYFSGHCGIMFEI